MHESNIIRDSSSPETPRGQDTAVCTQLGEASPTEPNPQLTSEFPYQRQFTNFELYGFDLGTLLGLDNTRAPTSPPNPSFHNDLNMGGISGGERQLPHQHALDVDAPTLFDGAFGRAPLQGQEDPGQLIQSIPGQSQSLLPTATALSDTSTSAHSRHVEHAPGVVNTTQTGVKSTSIRCTQCPKSFLDQRRLNRHSRDTHGPKTHLCIGTGCQHSTPNNGFRRKDGRVRHMRGCAFVPESVKERLRHNSQPAPSPMTSVGTAEDQGGTEMALPWHEKPPKTEDTEDADVQSGGRKLTIRIDRRLFELAIDFKIRPTREDEDKGPSS